MALHHIHGGTLQTEAKPIHGDQLYIYSLDHQDSSNINFNFNSNVVMVIDTKHLMKIKTYAKKKGITRQGVWNRIRSGILIEDKDYTKIDGDVFIISNSRVIQPKFRKEFERQKEEDELFIDTFN